jgi:uncharacterized protein YyaL (SSP411 family)
MQRYPGGFAALTIALEEAITPPTVVVLRGPRPMLAAWLGELAREHRPQRVLVAIDDGEGGVPAALDKPAARGRVNAYVCRGVTCLAPVGTLDALREVLAAGEIK